MAESGGGRFKRSFMTVTDRLIAELDRRGLADCPEARALRQARRSVVRPPQPGKPSAELHGEDWMTRFLKKVWH
ncbi:MAG: hypothetical protein HQL40_15820 [Alphaproteobacteria bacterium]|nr:hypothetical protein [Alphaproteobacteria bacterium]